MVVYSITNLLNGKKYIGQTIQEVSVRWSRHKTYPNIIRKAIYCYETDTVYRSVKEAANALGIKSASNLSRYCKIGKPTKGFTFKFIQESDMTNNILTGGGLLPL